MSPTLRSSAVAQSGSRLTRFFNAVIISSITTTCCKPIAAPIWIFLWGKAVQACRASVTEEGLPRLPESPELPKLMIDVKASGIHQSWQSQNSDLLRHDVGCAITATQETVGFVIPDDLLLRRVVLQGTPQAVRGVGQVHQCRRDVGLLDRGMNILGAAAANAINEVCEVVASCFTGRPRLGLLGQPGFIGIVPVNGEITIRAIKDVADGVGLCIFWSQRLFIGVVLAGARAQSRGRNPAGPVSTAADLGLVIRDP